MRLFVGNLAWAITEEELERIFTPYGTVRSIHLVTHRETGRSRGFGFVEMPYDTEAQDAITGLNGIVVEGRASIMAPATPVCFWTTQKHLTVKRTMGSVT